MNIKLELLINEISELVKNSIGNIEIDADKIADTKAIEIISKIQSIVKDNGLSDFDAMEKIVKIFENNNISTGERHDF